MNIRTSVVGAFGLALLTCLTVNATPFASCISNINNTIYFNLNEAGGNVTVTYEDGSTNASFNGVSTGLSLPMGYQHFDFTGHTSYNILVYKAGAGAPSIVTNIARGSARGIAANVRGASPYFGYVYSEIGGAGVLMMRSDGSGPVPGAALKPTPNNFTWSGSFQEYFISVAPDDSILISDFTSPSQGGVICANPQMTSANLLLSNDTGLLSGDMIDYNHGDIEARAILTAPLGSNASLWTIDGSYGDGSSVPYNTIMRYDLGTAVFDNGTLPWNGQPNLIGASVNPSTLQAGGSTGFFRNGFAIGTNGDIYVTVDRANLANPGLQVYATDAQTLLWSSFYTNSQGQLQDYLITGTQQLPQSGKPAAEMALSADNRYIACIHDDNHLTIFTLTNGIPDISTEYQIKWTNSTSTTTAGRFVCWDAANNLWVASPGLAVVDQISTGRTATTITTGNANGPTGFQTLASSELNIASTQPNAMAGGALATNVITRTGDITSPLVVPFTLGGTAPSSTYAVSATNTISFAAGQSSTNIVVTAIDDGAPHPTNTVVIILQDNGSGEYSVGSIDRATNFIATAINPLPIFSNVPPDSTTSCDSIPSVTNVTATGECDGNLAVSYSEQTIPGSCANSYKLVRTWSATDSCGGSTSASQTITVTDIVAPALVGVPADVTVDCDQIPSPSSVSGTDNCDTNPAVTLTETSTINGCGQGDYIISRTWTAVDACGNSSIQVQHLTVRDVAPHIITQPLSQTIFAGDTLNLPVIASGTNLSYQWTLNGTNIVDATNDTFVLTNALRANAGTYTVVLTGISVTNSDPAFVTVIDPVITNQPVSGNAPVGTKFTLSVGATGTPIPGYATDLHYQWYFERFGAPAARPLIGKTNAILQFTPIAVTNGGSYFCVVTNRFLPGEIAIPYANIVTSDVATVTTFHAPEVMMQPSNLVKTVGNNARFLVLAYDNSPIYYQWSFNGAPILGATQSAYSVFNVQLPDAGTYTCAISNALGAISQTSTRRGHLTVNPDTKNPASFIIYPSTDIVLTNGAPSSRGNITATAPETVLGGRAVDDGLITNITLVRTFPPWTTNSQWDVTPQDQSPTRQVWVTNLTLVSGTNTFVAIASDEAGKTNQSNPRTIFLRTRAQLTVNINGIGKTVPVGTRFGAAKNGAYLDVNRGYSIKAIPGTNGVNFVNWTDGSGTPLSNGPTLQFAMTNGLILNANFDH